jgi:hypothetical protein
MTNPADMTTTTKSPRKRARRPVDTAAYFAMVRRIIRAGARRLEHEDPEIVFEQVNMMAGEVEAARAAAVYGLRRAGYSDVQIAHAFGMTKQAIGKRYPSFARTPQIPSGSQLQVDRSTRS